MFQQKTKLKYIFLFTTNACKYIWQYTSITDCEITYTDGSKVALKFN